MSTRYTTYTARVGRDSTLPVRYEEAVGGGLVRVHYTLNRIAGGRAVDDPLIQLELEMMIECTSEVDA